MPVHDCPWLSMPPPPFDQGRTISYLNHLSATISDTYTGCSYSGQEREFRGRMSRIPLVCSLQCTRLVSTRDTNHQQPKEHLTLSINHHAYTDTHTIIIASGQHMAMHFSDQEKRSSVRTPVTVKNAHEHALLFSRFFFLSHPLVIRSLFAFLSIDHGSIFFSSQQTPQQTCTQHSLLYSVRE